MFAGAIGLRKQQLEIIVRTHRVAEKQTLRVRAIVALQERQLFFRFDAFGNDVQVQPLAHVNDRADNRCIVGVDREVLDERFVDLECVDRKLLQRAERRVACAKVVDGKVQAKCI